ncbi:hypothetical protein CK203_037044 [Vitis vinifera]|uniref:Uncharacterized protein n=1 Tax=Vitis vinifera TaxID=29760 RepID=A0A438I5W1_VITVI|nr:hypothetical protein CK203_037044 [Vitis vinifera]
MLRKLWEGIRVSGSASFILVEKLKALKPILRSWNKEVFGKVETQKQRALNLVDFWDKKESARSLSMEEEEARKEAKETYKKWVLLEEALWRQKFREMWLKEGIEIQEVGRIGCGRGGEAFCGGGGLWCVVRFCGKKAPDPDSFPMAFYLNSWDFVKVEVMNFFRQFHDSGSFVRSLNATFLVRIPKKVWG